MNLGTFESYISDSEMVSCGNIKQERIAKDLDGHKKYLLRNGFILSTIVLETSYIAMVLRIARNPKVFQCLAISSLFLDNVIFKIATSEGRICRSRKRQP